jgi:DNA-binding MarR family transcriptional regulator
MVYLSSLTKYVTLQAVTTPRRASPAREVDAVADRLHSAATHLLRRLRVYDEALGISAPRLSALSVLAGAGPLRIGELARAEQVEAPTMTRLIDGLERDGLVERIGDPEDARAIVVRPTDAGLETFAQDRRRRVEAFAALLRPLPARDLTAVGRGVDALERALTAGDARA